MEYPPSQHSSAQSYRLGLLGYPLGHSLSPVLHEQLLEYAGLQGQYDLIPVQETELEETLARLANEGYAGVNVTIPHKVAVMKLMDELCPLAQRVGAVNTVVFRPNGKCWGTNTDVSGFWRSIPEEKRKDCHTKSVILLGSGGAALAVAAAIIGGGMKTLRVVVRDVDKAQENILAMKAMAESSMASNPTDIEVMTWEQLTPEKAAEAHWIVNATPIGMSPHEETAPTGVEVLEALDREGLMMDLVYRPELTQWLRSAKKLPITKVSGLPMLVHQGIAAFEHWTGASMAGLDMRELKSYLRRFLTQQS